jgi:endonuclease/exonuclease/phosphatase family metal-dependent hydrolase
MHLRVAVMNVQTGLGTTRGWWEYARLLGRIKRRTRHVARIGAAFQRAEVDLAILQEVDGGSGRTGGVDQAALLAEHSRLASFHFFPCLQLVDRVNQGNAVHARTGVRGIANHALPGHGEPRYLSEAVVERDDRTLHVFAAHTSLKTAVRREQLQEIHRIVGLRQGPVLLGGDFNARRSDELDHLSAALRQVPAGPTFPSWRPRWALDHLFVSPHFRVRAARVADEVREADHLPVVVDLELAGAEV